MTEMEKAAKIRQQLKSPTWQWRCIDPYWCSVDELLHVSHFPAHRPHVCSLCFPEFLLTTAPTDWLSGASFISQVGGQKRGFFTIVCGTKWPVGAAGLPCPSLLRTEDAGWLQVLMLRDVSFHQRANNLLLKVWN